MEPNKENPFARMVRRHRWQHWSDQLERIGQRGFLVFASAAMVVWIGEDNGTMSTGAFERDMLVTGTGIGLSIGAMVVAGCTSNVAAESAAIVNAHSHPELTANPLDSES